MEIEVGDARLECLVEGRGPLVICLHGFPDVFTTFGEQIPALVEAGYRVAAPAMRGYVPSTVSSEGRYDVEALADDVVAIADRLSPDAPVRLFGHDWGAVAAQAACASRPWRFRRLVTAAVPPVRLSDFLRLRQLRRSWYMGFFQLPRLSEARLLTRHGALVDRLWRDWSPGYVCPAEHLEEVKATVRAHPRDVLAYYRALPRSLRSPLLRRAHGVRSLHIHGRQDGCVGVEVVEAARGRTEVEVLPGGHFVHLEQPERVNRLLVGFFRAQDSGGGGGAAAASS